MTESTSVLVIACYVSAAPNQWLERTAGQRRWPVPSALRAAAAAQPHRLQLDSTTVSGTIAPWTSRSLGSLRLWKRSLSVVVFET